MKEAWLAQAKALLKSIGEETELFATTLCEELTQGPCAWVSADGAASVCKWGDPVQVRAACEGKAAGYALTLGLNPTRVLRIERRTEV